MCSSMPGSARIDACRPLQTIWQYGSSEKTISSLPRTTSAISARSSRVATPPVGLCGELRMIPRGLGSLARNRRTASAEGRKSCSTCKRRKHGPRPSSLEVGNVGRKLRAENQHPVARVEHRLGEILLERLGARPDDDVLGRHGIAKLGRDETGPPLRENRAAPGSGSSPSRYPRSPGCRLASRAVSSETDCRRSPARRRPSPWLEGPAPPPAP